MAPRFSIHWQRNYNDVLALPIVFSEMSGRRNNDFMGSAIHRNSRWIVITLSDRQRRISIWEDRGDDCRNLTQNQAALTVVFGKIMG
jgi:hypothetical protein